MPDYRACEQVCSLQQLKRMYSIFLLVPSLFTTTISNLAAIVMGVNAVHSVTRPLTGLERSQYDSLTTEYVIVRQPHYACAMDDSICVKCRHPSVTPHRVITPTDDWTSAGVVTSVLLNVPDRPVIDRPLRMTILQSPSLSATRYGSCMYQSACSLLAP